MLEIMHVGKLPATTLSTNWTLAGTAILKATSTSGAVQSIETRDASLRVYDQTGKQIYEFIEAGTAARTHNVSIPKGTSAISYHTQPRNGANLSLTGSTVYIDITGGGLPVASNIVEIRDWGNAQLHRIACQNNPSLIKVPSELPEVVSRLNNSFNGCTALNDPSISAWDTSRIVVMSAMLQMCSAFNQPIGHWNVSNVTSFNSMIRACSNFNQPLNDWNVSNGTLFSSMFNLASKFNQPLDRWNMSKAQYITSMFQAATVFNQNLSGWDTRSIIDRANYDADCPAWQAVNKPKFN